VVLKLFRHADPFKIFLRPLNLSMSLRTSIYLLMQ